MWNIVDPLFWFDMTSVRMGGIFTTSFFVLFAAFLFVGSGARVAKRNAEVDKSMKRFLENVAGKAFTWGVLGFLWLFLSFEEISFFGSRFWILLWALGVALAGRGLYLHWTKIMPEERLRRAQNKEQDKYLPRRAR